MARLPRLAGEVAQAFHTSLDTVLNWPADKILFWHGEAVLIAEERLRR